MLVKPESLSTFSMPGCGPAKAVQISANSLIACANPKDRDGICHQLVNEERLRWTTK